MTKETKDKIVLYVIWIVLSIGIVLFVSTLLVFAFKVGLLFFLFIMGLLLLFVAYMIAKIYFDDVEL